VNLGRGRLFVPVPIFLSLLVTQAVAGNNAAGTVHLSWESETLSTIIAAPPVSPPFALFVVIENAPDIQAFGVTLRWFPHDPTLRMGYDVLPAAADSSCGWRTSIPPTEPFQGDSTYSGTILFPPGSDETCIAYFFQGPACDNLPPAVFQVVQLIVQDSHGVYDTLRVTGSAKYTGGSDCEVDDQFEEAAAAGSNLAMRLTPNPVKGAAQLSVVLPGAGVVELGIYDVRGRLIMPLFKNTLPAGVHTYAWQLNDRDGRRVPNGIYFARLRGPTGSRAATILVAR
jgi:hypothetical protein